MSISSEWAPYIGAIGALVILFVNWRIMNRGWKRDMERERLAREADAAGPAE